MNLLFLIAVLLPTSIVGSRVSSVIEAVISIKAEVAHSGCKNFKKAEFDLSFIQSEIDASVFFGILMYEMMGYIKIDPTVLEQNENIRLTKSTKLFMLAVCKLEGLNCHFDRFISSNYGYNSWKPSTIREKMFIGTSKYNTRFISKLLSRLLETSRELRENRMNVNLVISVYTYWLQCVVRGQKRLGKETFAPILSLCLLDNKLIDLELRQLVTFASFRPKPSIFYFNSSHQLRNVVMLASIINNSKKYGNLILKNAEIINCLITKENYKMGEILFHLLSPRKRELFCLLYGVRRPSFHFSVGNGNFGLVSYFSDERLLTAYLDDLILINRNKLNFLPTSYMLTSEGRFYKFEYKKRNHMITNKEEAFFFTEEPDEFLSNENAPLFAQEKLNTAKDLYMAEWTKPVALFFMVNNNIALIVRLQSEK